MENTAEKIERNITVDDVIGEIVSVDSQIESLKKKRLDLESDLWQFVGSELTNNLADKEYSCGTVNAETDKYAIKYTVSKKVVWDQEILAHKAEELMATGRDPHEYIKYKYEISEAAYKNWPSDISKYFEAARTVEPSKGKFSFEMKE